ncbi:hypothetical protein GUJ93_ZPchr0001g29990 [Zizania palustris]|uniref:Secreted protein n=1 Tax=Zizania palustris TaxID=103762 RepID=A0A8J5RW11_ZIZPA|nr:hypothetical protein GUJ93_ZPchr0001g29990 [Zizania palustris]
MKSFTWLWASKWCFPEVVLALTRWTCRWPWCPRSGAWEEGGAQRRGARGHGWHRLLETVRPWVNLRCARRQHGGNVLLDGERYEVLGHGASTA